MARDDKPSAQWATNTSAVISVPGTVRTQQGFDNGKAMIVGQVNSLFHDITGYLDDGQLEAQRIDFAVSGSDKGNIRAGGLGVFLETESGSKFDLDVNDDLVLNVSGDTTWTPGGATTLEGHLTADAHKYRTAQTMTVRGGAFQHVDGVTPAPVFDRTEPGPIYTSGDTLTVRYRASIQVPATTSQCTYTLTEVGAHLTRNNADSSTTLNIIERSYSGSVVTEVVKATIASGSNNWAPYVTSSLTITLDPTKDYEFESVMAFSGSGSRELGWGGAYVKISKTAIE